MTTSQPSKCPYSVGQTVVYRPSRRGLDSDVMAPPSQRLIPGQSYRVAAVVEEVYLVPEGYRHPGGGIYWTEFAAQ